MLMLSSEKHLIFFTNLSQLCMTEQDSKQIYSIFNRLTLWRLTTYI